jgi:hypothetical protein
MSCLGWAGLGTPWGEILAHNLHREALYFSLDKTLKKPRLQPASDQVFRKQELQSALLLLPDRMPASFDKCQTRPPHIDAILSGLDRYNPETTTIFQDYVSNQCEEKTFDAYACLALLKLYVKLLNLRGACASIR